MKTLRKIRKSIAKKFKKGAATAVQDPRVSSSTAKKLSEDIVEMQVVTSIQDKAILDNAEYKSEKTLNVTENKGTTVIDKATDTPVNAKDSEKVLNATGDKGTASVIDEARQTDDKLHTTTEDATSVIDNNEAALYEDINIDGEDLEVQQPMSSENVSTEQEPTLSTEENSAGEKPSTKAIIAGIIGVALLISCVVSYIMKMPVVAVVVGIAGLACIDTVLSVNKKIIKIVSLPRLYCKTKKYFQFTSCIADTDYSYRLSAKVEKKEERNKKRM